MDVTLECEVMKYIPSAVRVTATDAPELPSPTTSQWLSAKLGSAKRTNPGLLTKDPPASPGLPAVIAVSWASATLEPSAGDRSQPMHRSAALAIDTDKSAGLY